MARAADAATGTKVANELFFQGAASLDEKGCDRSSRVTPHLRALGILIPQPTCDLLRRPVLLEFTRYDPLQPWVPGEHTGLWVGLLNPKPFGRRERPDSLLDLRAERLPRR